MISVNECDPLRDEGVNFYRLLLRAGVDARCRQVMGTIHGTEIFPLACPDISEIQLPAWQIFVVTVGQNNGIQKIGWAACCVDGQCASLC